MKIFSCRKGRILGPLETRARLLPPVRENLRAVAEYFPQTKRAVLLGQPFSDIVQLYGDTGLILKSNKMLSFFSD